MPQPRCRLFAGRIGYRRLLDRPGRPCYPLGMSSRLDVPCRVCVLICTLLVPAGLFAQNRRRLPAPDESAYGSKFFEQLRNIFGRFQEDDLERVFQAAKPIPCGELLGGKGEWKEVAFFNENRKLGDWYRESMEEVRSDFTVFGFKGACRGDQGSIRVSTEFPITASIDAYNRREISLDQVEVNVNDPVNASFDQRTSALTFVLPYLFRSGHDEAAGDIYSLMAPDRKSVYATAVTSRWECKAVKSEDVTYRFLICRTTLLNVGLGDKRRQPNPSFGASAYLILSDGTEAQTEVSLTFEGTEPAKKPPDETTSPDLPTDVPGRPKLIRDWIVPDSGVNLVDATTGEFHLFFNTRTWSGKIGTSQVLSRQRMSDAHIDRLPQDTDYCIWRPETPDNASRLLESSPGTDISFSMGSRGKTLQSAGTVVFVASAPGGIRLGSLQCVFPGINPMAGVTIERWAATVGDNITLKVRP